MQGGAGHCGSQNNSLSKRQRDQKFFYLLSRSEGRIRKILGQVASPKKEEYNEEERKELMRVLNEEVVSESGGGSTMESESDKMLGGNSIHFDSRLFFVF